MTGRQPQLASSLRLGTLLVRQQGLTESSDAAEPGDDLDALRICYLDWGSGLVGLIDLKAHRTLGFLEALEEIDTQLASGSLRTAEQDPWLRRPPAKDSAAHLETAKMRHAVLRPYLVADERRFFQREGRHALLREIATSSDQSIVTIRSWLRAYYVGGMTTLALAPDYRLCGGPGKRRSAGAQKRGRPKTVMGKPVSAGVNVDEISARKLHDGYQTFRIRGKMSRDRAYNHSMARYFSDGFERDPVSGRMLPKFFPKDERPTLWQFLYWARKIRNTRHDAAHRHGSRRYEKDHRPILGSARSGIISPGQMYQVDATGGLVHLVARDNCAERIGKAVVYVVVDTYSSLVVGFATSLEAASYTALMPALAHAFAPKETLGNLCGDPFVDDQWPGGVVCETLLTDRGAEFLGKNIETAALAIGFDISHAAPGRPDSKPYAERAFGYLKASLRDIPGASQSIKERGTRDPKEDALITFDEFDQIVATVFQNYNHGRVIDDHPDALRLAQENLLPTPYNLWHYGIREKGGAGRVYSSDDIKLALLPRKTAKATAKGLEFDGLAYKSELLRNEGAFLRGTGHRRQRCTVIYDPRNLSTVLLIDSSGKVIERCELTPRFSHLEGISLWEWEARKQRLKELREAGKHRRGQHQVATDQAIQEIVGVARAKKTAAGASAPEFDAAAQVEEKAARRAEQAWISTQTKPAMQAPGPGYVPQPSLAAELDDEEGDES